MIICEIAKPNVARIIINFLPYLSPRFPHSEERNKETKNGPAKINPLHFEVSSIEVTPSSLTNKGRNGTMELIPTIARN